MALSARRGHIGFFLCAFFALSLFLTSSVRAAKLSDMVLTNTPSSLLLYLKVKEAFNEETQKAVFNGVPTTFSFFISLEEVRSFWRNRKIADFKLKHTLKYNTLKKEFKISRSWEEEAGEQQTISFDEAKSLMTRINGFSLFPLSSLKKGRKYRVRAKAKLSKIDLPFYMHYIVLLSSNWEFETEWYSIEFDY